MKNFLIVIVVLLSCYSAKAQTINDKLYKAVSGKDTLHVQQLLDMGADANYIVKRMQSETTLLILSVLNVDFTTVKLLVEHKAEIDRKDWFHTTPLMYAAYKGNLDIIKYLLEHGADINAKDEQGNNVLSSAKESKNPEAIKIIEAALNKK